METERLLLRRAKPEDAVAMHLIRNSEHVLQYNAMPPCTPERTAQLVEEDMQSDRVFYIEEKETGQLLGQIAIEEDAIRYKVSSCCLSYYLGKEHCGKGYMTEALREIIRHCFTALQAEVVSARVFSRNTPSLRLLERLGFVREGCVRKCVLGYGNIVFDDVLFSVFKEEFAAVPWPL